MEYWKGMDEAGFAVNIHLASDTLSFNADTSRLWINNMNSYGADVQVALQYAVEGNSTAAYSKVQAINSKLT